VTVAAGPLLDGEPYIAILLCRYEQLGTWCLGETVPAYDYRCLDCGAKFELRMSMAAYAEGAKPTCDACGSARVERAFTAVSVLTAGRGASAAGVYCGGGRRGFS